MPFLGDLDARICAKAVLSSNTRSIKASTLPPLSFCPNSRAFITLVLLNTKTSLAETQLLKFGKMLSNNGCSGKATNNLLLPRTTGGY